MKKHELWTVDYIASGEFRTHPTLAELSYCTHMLYHSEQFPLEATHCLFQDSRPHESPEVIVCELLNSGTRIIQGLRSRE